MQRNDNEIKTVELILKGASYFLAGMFIITTIIPSVQEPLEFQGYLTIGIGIAVCFFGFMVALSTFPIKLTRNFAERMNSWATQHSYIVFAAVVLEIVKYAYDFRDFEILRIVSIIFLILFVSLVLTTYLIAKKGIFSNVKSNLLFILAMTLFSLLLVLTEEPTRWQLFTLFLIILLSSLRLWFLIKRTDKEAENKVSISSSPSDAPESMR